MSKPVFQLNLHSVGFADVQTYGMGGGTTHLSESKLLRLKPKISHELPSLGPVQLILILERITDGFFAVDREWRILFSNEPAEHIAGKSKAEVLGQKLWDVVPQYVGTEIQSRYLEAMEQQKRVHFVTYLSPFRVWIETRIYPSADGLTVYFRDVTAEKQSEIDLKKTLKGLEQTTAELERSNQELSEFAAVTSHDLKEPIKAIYLCLELLEKTLNNEQRQDLLVKARTSAQKCLSFVDSLLHHSSVGKSTQNKVLLSIEDVIESAKVNIAPLIREAEAEIVSNARGKVFADEVQLIRIFQNLFSNSLKFRKPGIRPVISVNMTSNDSHFKFRVKDNGIGFDGQDSEIIFQLYKRGSERSPVPGNGIGLATVKKIVELHGGKIEAHSSIGEGAEFIFTIEKNDPQC